MTTREEQHGAPIDDLAGFYEWRDEVTRPEEEVALSDFARYVLTRLGTPARALRNPIEEAAVALQESDVPTDQIIDEWVGARGEGIAGIPKNAIRGLVRRVVDTYRVPPEQRRADAEARRRERAARLSPEEEEELSLARQRFEQPSAELARIIGASGLDGYLQADIDFVRIHQIIVEEYGDSVSSSFLTIPEGPDIAGSEQFAARQALEQFFLSGGNEEILIDAFNIYAFEVGSYKSPEEKRIDQVAESSGLDRATARRVVSASDREGIDEIILAAAVKGQIDRGGLDLSSVRREVLRDVTEGEWRAAGRTSGPRNRPTEFRSPDQKRTDFLGNSVTAIAREFSDHLNSFWSPATALVSYLDDSDLAARLQQDPWSISPNELRRIRRLLGDSKDPEIAAAANWIDQRLSGAFRDVHENVDTGTVREAARGLAAAWNLPDLGDSFLDNLAVQYAAQYAVGLDNLYGNPFSEPDMDRPRQIIRHVSGAGAMSAAALRNTTAYQELFGRKADGESEEEYVARFEQMAGQSFGAGFDESTEAVRAGQRSGESQDVRGYGIASGAAFDSTTFQQQLHSMANTLRSMT